MRLGNSSVRLGGLIWLLLLPMQSAAAADEAALIDEFNGIVGKLNGGEFAEARKQLDAFEKTAKEVKAGDPAHKRAQDLLKQVPSLRLNSYHNSAINAKNAADEAVQAVKLDEAAAQLKQFVADSAELLKLKPGDKSYQQQRTKAEQQLAQVEIVRALLSGKPIDDKQLTAAAAEKPKQLFESAPGFALPRVDRPQWVSPLAEPGQVVAIQVFQAGHETAAFAARSVQALGQQYGSRGLSIFSVAINEGDELAKLDAFIKTHKPTWPVLLDDRADFYQQYMQGGYYLPAYVVVGRDRRACWINGASPLETTGMLAAKIHEEITKPAVGVPAGPIDDFPPSVPFPATRVKDAVPVTIRFGGKPALMVVASEPQDGPHLAELAAVGQEYAGKIQTLAVVRGDKFAAVRELAEKHDLDFQQIRWGMPSVYGPNFNARLVLVSRGGRILKVAPLTTDGQHVRALLARYAAVLTTSGAYPESADAPLGTNLAHRLAGGAIEKVSSARQQGSQQRLNDGVSGAEGWSPSDSLPQEATLSFLGKARATFDRLTIDRRSGLGQFEVLAADESSGPFRSLGKFQADEREARQAFALPKTNASTVKLRFLSTTGRQSRQVELGEIEISEAAGVQPPLSQRLAADYAGSDGIRADFETPELPFWEQTDFVFGLGNAEWRVEDGRLSVSGMPQIGELRATALLHASPAVSDFRLGASVRSRGNQAGGIVFDFRDWDNHLRLVLVQGHVQTGRSVGNSIRLERWRQGRLEVLGVHGEAFPHGEPIRLEVQRQGEKLAVKAQDKVLFALDGVSAEAGRVGFCAAGGDFEVDEIHLAPLAAGASWNVAPPSALSTAAGASLVWLSSQGDDQHPEAWASNLLRNPVFVPPAAWEASRDGQDMPEAVFAFRDHAELSVQGVEFDLPASTGAEAGNLVRKVEVLAASDSPLDADAFRTLGQFSLEARSGPQKFALKAPAACRYLKLRLLENGGGDKFAIARFDVQIDANSLPSTPTADRQATGREETQQQFAFAADDEEKEPNDDVAAAKPLRNAKSLDAAIHFGQADFFRLPPPPAGKGLKSLRVTLDALPWLRLKASLCDESGAPLDPPLAQFAAGQHAEQTRQVAAGAKPPGFLRVEMPAASLALILDTSGSMGGREEDVRAAVNGYLAGAADSEQIEVIEFNTEVGVIGRLPDDRQKVADAIERLGVRGNTALYEALLAGMKKNQAVVLLSDGMNTVFKADFTDLCRRLGKQPVPIYVVGIGWDLHEYDANSGNTAYSLLSNLARQTGGQFYFSPESQQLAALYQQIAAEVRGQTRYRLRAEWEVSERTVELATIDRRGLTRRRPVSLPLPPDLPELAVGRGVRLARGPKYAGMPPNAVDLAPPARRGAVQGPLIASLPGVRTSELARLPRLSIDRPRPALLPELTELSVSYKPPKAGDPLLPPAVLPAFELVFDSSESMKELMDGKPKIEIARAVISDLAEALPANAQVGLRLYGHWGPWIARKTDPQGAQVGWEDARLNTDSDLVVPIGPIDVRQRAELKRWIKWTQPRGKTPMVFSLLEARKDFSVDWKGPRTVILVSDGVETCGGKLDDLAKAYRGTGINAVIHVVGFDIAGTDAEKQLREIANIGSGDYYGAQNARQLSAALKAAAAAGAYTVYDDAGKVAARGAVNGKPVPLLPGTYRVRLNQVMAKELEIPVTNGPALRLNLREDGGLARP